MQTLDFSKTLFVCTGNVYRSYISEQIFQGISKKLNKSDVTCWSRGTELYFDAPHPEVIKYCESVCEYDFNQHHQPHQINIEDADNASIIIGFTQSHIDYINQKFPEVSRRLYLFTDIFGSLSSVVEDIAYEDVTQTNSTLQFNILSIIQAIENKFLGDAVSIIIPVHNEVKNISNLLKMIIKQMHNNDEINVISSASSDGTDEAINSVIKLNLDYNIKLIQQNSRLGKVSALKLGVAASKNKTSILIDGDIKISENFRYSLENLNTSTCYTGRISLEATESKIINKVSYVSTEAWNNLRKLLSDTGKFLYPSGYCMVMPRRYLQYALHRTSDRTVNDDANIARELNKKNILFKYNPNIEVFVKFPQTWNDFLKQKIRTRLGRIQNKSIEYSQTEKLWRKQVMSFLNTRYLLPALILLAVDFICRMSAKVKFLFGSNHHIWTMVKSTK